MSTTTRAAPSAEFSAALVHAVGTTWAGIRDRHPDVPDVMITVGAGAEKQALKLGHFAAAAWQAGDQHVSELFVGGEGLARGAEALLATLLHECAHGIANTREIQDTSRQGRYHNAKFRDLPTEVGIAVSKDAKIDWSPTQLAPGTLNRYSAEVAALAAVVTAHRRQFGAGDDQDKKKSNNGCAAFCTSRSTATAA